MHRRLALQAAGIAALALPAHAQTAADRPVRIIVPFSAGGPTDVLARVLAPLLSASMKRTVIVENRAGATGAIGAAHVAKSAADGDTLLLGTSSIMAASPNLSSKLPYDPVQDFAPVSLIANIENVLVVHPSVPARTVRELVDYARANPGKLTYASSGAGSTYHLGGELFRTQTGIDITHVPYKGAAPAIQDVLAGHVHMMFDNMSSAIPNIQAGRVRALGVASRNRYPALPQLPTIEEAGVPGYETTIWLAFFAPARTPQPVLERLGADIHAAVNSTAYRERLQALDIQPATSSREQLAGYLKAELAKWHKVVKAAGIVVE
ncbi:Bug family tripartite tricarboxylate transporter substrate binding protein [Pseudorhodoferax sp.]|uniref:Bug family tripartite tricarboxylate transporter substrate binding protein n=1 Tax=Pseudorhodoferax sp. TaxID=1993553 RepID=UPI002DD657CC|nr:tripartite tricarboxylate transporter substrate binding protein [Pseudorhodoferax sp.]